MQERPYSLLPMSVLLETMRQGAATVRVQASIAALPEGWNEPCVAELDFVEERLHACTIRTTEGLLLLRQEAAYQMLQRLGTLEWTLARAREHASGWQVACSISSEVLASLSQRHKQVLLLLESHKRPEEIARLLQLPLYQVEQILQALLSRYVISRTHERRNR